MNTVFGYKHPLWNLNKSQYDEVDDLPLMATVGPVLTILAVYLVFVLKIGPSFMRKREGYKLTATLTLYNAAQVLISAYLVYRFGEGLIRLGLVPKQCVMHDDKLRREVLIGTYLYFVAKLTELLDTIFFVLRKKDSQVTFLHLYHHSVMVIATWALLKYWPSHTLAFIGFLNSLVHVFMYTYYGLAAMGSRVAKHVFWKKYMTRFQLIQFMLIIIQYVATVRISDCPPAKGVAIFVSCNTVFILILFLNFYCQNYRKKEKKDFMNGLCMCINKED